MTSAGFGDVQIGHAFVTGAAGFIGSNVVDRLLASGIKVTGYDNLSTGREDFLQSATANANFQLVRGDLLDTQALTAAMADVDMVFHLAANADIRFGVEHPRKDLEQNTIATFNVLEAARLNAVRRIIFSSTGSVYGEAEVIPTPEDAPFPIQTSLYGASKLAGEAMIAAYTEGFDIQAIVFRFVSILGERYTHGHVFDFVKRLRKDPTSLRILGDGKQRKSYLYVHDCISAMLTAIAKTTSKFEIYNLGCDHYCEVADSARWICDEMGLAPTLNFTGGDRGWIGDNPFIFLDTAKIRSLGWEPALSIRQGVEATTRYLLANPDLLDGRE